MTKLKYIALFLAIAALVWTVPVRNSRAAAAVTFYVDGSIVDTNVASATCDFTTYNPATFATDTGSDCVYKTIADVNLKSPAAGDSVLFRKGQTWREQLTVPASGSAGLPITYGAYGSGDKPVISGADLVTSWTQATTTATFYPAENADDVRVNTNASELLDDGWLRFGNAGGNLRGGGIRFKGVTVAKNATVSGAVIRLQAMYNDTGDDCNLTIAGELNATPEAFSTYTNYADRTRTTATVAWDTVGHWTAESSYDTADISASLNEIFALAGWASGQDVVIFITNNSSTAEAVRYAYPFNASSGTKKAQLVIPGGAPIANVYQATVAQTPTVVWYDGTRLTYHAGVTTGVGSNEWDIGGNTLYVNVGGNPTGHTVLATQRSYGIFVSGKNYITITGLNPLNAGTDGVNLAPTSTDITISDCEINGNYRFGVGSNINYTSDSVSNVLVTTSIIHHNGSTGIRGAYYNINHTYSHNTIYRNSLLTEGDTDLFNWTGGIYCVGPTSNSVVIEYNDVYENGKLEDDSWIAGTDRGCGIWVDTIGTATGTGIHVRYNKVHGNKDAGISIENIDGARVYCNLVYDHKGQVGSKGIWISCSNNTYPNRNNLVYNNTVYDTPWGLVNYGYSAAGTSVGNVFKNNISFGYSLLALRALYGGENDGTFGSGNIYTYNDFGPEASNFIEWGLGVYKSTYSAWETAYGGTTNSIQSDPLFVTPGTDFHLQSTSPCINAGTNVSLTTDYAGNAIVGNPDCGAYERQTTFYVDSGIVDTNVGDDIPDFYTYNPSTFSTTTGTSPVFKTIADVNAFSPAAGDSVLFRKGQTWREQLTVPASGSAGLPITYGAFGTGDKPVINGSDILTAWTNTAGTTYTKTVATEPRIVLYNGTRLTKDIFDPTETANTINEKFETNPGYDTASWSTNGSPDPDALSSAAGSPSNWGTECLKVVSTGDSDVNIYRTLSDPAISYTRVDFVLTAHSMASENDSAKVMRAYDSAFASAWTLVLRQLSGAIKIVLFAYHDGTLHQYNSFSSLLVNTRYTVEVKWDATNNVWAWKIDGIAQSNDADATAPVTSEGALSSTHSTSIRYIKVGSYPEGANYMAYTAYFDKVAIDTTTWVDGLGTELESNKYNYTGTTLAVNVGEDPSTHDLEAAIRDYAVSSTGKNYINFENLTLTKSNHSGVMLSNSSNIDMNAVDITQIPYAGTRVMNVATSQYLTFRYMTVTYCGATGISVDGDSDNTGHVWIHHNTVSNCGWNDEAVDASKWTAGIKVWGGYGIGGAGESDYCTIEDNEVSSQVDVNGDGSGCGIWLDEWGTNGIIRRNKVHANATYGIFVEHTEYTVDVSYNLSYLNKWGISVYRGISNAYVYNNTVYGNTNIGLWCQGGETLAPVNNLFKNNISTGNTINLSATAGGENAGAGSGNVYIYNALGPAATNFIEWGADVYKSTYAAFETAYGGSTYSIQADPLFVSTVTHDFHLQPTSPCINAGIGVGLLTDYAGTAIVCRPEIGAYEYPLKGCGSIIVIMEDELRGRRIK